MEQNILKLSEKESQILNFKVYRSNGYLDNVDTKRIDEEIKFEKPDICRLKIKAMNTSIFKDIKKLNYPFDIFTINNFNEVEITKSLIDNIDFESTNLSVELVENTNSSKFKDTLLRILKTKSWFEYDSSLMSFLVSKEKALELSIKYYSGFSTDEINGKSWYLKSGDEIVGIFLGHHSQNIFHGILYGILPEYRGLGYSKWIYKFMFYECYKMDITTFVNDISIFNSYSMRSAKSELMKVENSYININIFPLLSLRNFKESKEEISLGNFKNFVFDQMLYGDSNSVLINKKISRLDNAENISLFIFNLYSFEDDRLKVIHKYSNKSLSEVHYLFSSNV